MLTPDDRYIGLEQATVSAPGIVDDFAPKSRVTGTVELAGATWQVRAESDGDRVYVRDFGETSVLVIGSAKRADVERGAGASRRPSVSSIGNSTFRAAVMRGTRW